VLHSSFTSKGKIVHMKNAHGHDIELDVVLGHAKIEDLLKLGVKTDPLIMTGAVAMKTRLLLLPGPADVADRLRLDGTFHVSEGHFDNDKVQNRIDSLSLRSRGKPKLAHAHGEENVKVTCKERSRLVREYSVFPSCTSRFPALTQT